MGRGTRTREFFFLKLAFSAPFPSTTERRRTRLGCPITGQGLIQCPLLQRTLPSAPRALGSGVIVVYVLRVLEAAGTVPVSLPAPQDLAQASTQRVTTTVNADIAGQVLALLCSLLVPIPTANAVIRPISQAHRG